MRRIFTLVVCSVGLVSATAQTVFTLDECIEAAVRNNLKMERAQNDVLSSDLQQREAFTKYFPSVSAIGTGMAAKKHLVQMDVAGMSMGLVKNGVAGNVSVMQPLFAGGQIVNGNRLARVGAEVSRLQHHLTENEVRLTAETYFWQIVLLKEKLRTLDKVEVQMENARKDAQTAVLAGVRNRNDLLQVQLRQNELVSARIRVQNGLNVMKDLLAQYTGHMADSIDVDFTIYDSVAVAPPQAFYIKPEASLAVTDEYKLLGKQVEAEKLNYKLAVGKNLPSLAVGGMYYYNNLMDKSANNLVGMITLSVPISDWWGGSHNMKRKKLDIANAENELKDKSQQLIIRMRKAWNDVTDAYLQIGIAREAVAQSEENLRLNTDSYQAGTVTMGDFLDAQTLYQQARDRYVEAYTQYAVKTREYLQATGR